MLKEILSVSGKSGLFKRISQGKNMLIAESLIDQKRVPLYPRDKVISLGDISIFSTGGEDTPLYKVLISIKQKEDGKPIDFNPAIKPDELKTYFAEILPDFDKDRVYPSDIKKIMAWYNLLISKGFTDFEIQEEQEEKQEENNTDEIQKKEL